MKNKSPKPTLNTADKEIEAFKKQIASAESARAKINQWEHAKLAAADQRIAHLRRDFETAELKQMPVPAQASTLKFKEKDVPVSAIVRTGNHRESTDEAATIRLARTLNTLGLQQRIGLRDRGDGTFELIFGSRRLTAAESIGWTEIPAKVYPPTLTAAEVEIIRTVENFGRQDMTHVERAIAVARVLDSVQQAIAGNFDPEEFPQTKTEKTLKDAVAKAGGIHAYVGQQLGFPEKWVRDNAYVSQLGGESRKLLAAHRIDIGHARELAKLGDPTVADQIAGMVCRSAQGLGGESIEKCKTLVVKHMRSLRIVPWRLDVAFGAGVKGCTGQACTTCRFNSKSDPDLFGGAIADEPEAGVCTNEACYTAKQAIATKDVDKATAKVVKHAAARTGTVINDTLAIQFAPVHVKPATVARKAKKQMEAVGGGSESVGKSAGDASAKETPEQKAQRKLDDAKRQWYRESVDAMQNAAFEKPGRVLAMMLLDCMVPRFNVDVDALADLKAEIEASAAADITALLLLEKSLKDRDLVSASILEHPSEDVLSAIGAAWKLPVLRMPVLADFMPKVKAEKTATLPVTDGWADVPLTEVLREAGVSFHGLGTIHDGSAEHRGNPITTLGQLCALVDEAQKQCAGVDPIIPGTGAKISDRILTASRSWFAKRPECVGTVLAVKERKCRVCGCTEANCTGCVERTGMACYWVSEDLCSACVSAPATGDKPKKKAAGNSLNLPTDPFHEAKNRDSYEKVPVAAVLKAAGVGDVVTAAIFEVLPAKTTLGVVEDRMANARELVDALPGLDQTLADILADTIRQWFEPPTQEQIEDAGAAQGRIDGSTAKRRKAVA